MERERSVASAVVAALALAALGASLTLPWFTYDHSTGRQTPEGGFHDPAEDGVVRSHHEAGPGGTAGDAAAADAASAEGVLLALRTFLVIAATGFLVVLLAPWRGLERILVRPIVLAAAGLATAAALAAVALLWSAYPDAFLGSPQAGPFLDRLDGSGYTRTALGWGWVLGALAVPAGVASFLLRFQAGSTDPALVVEVARRSA